MKTTFQIADLKRAWSTLVGVVPSRSTMPACLNVAIKTEASRCVLQATDMELSVRLNVAAEVAANGETLLPASRMQSILRESPGSTVEIATGAKLAVGPVATITCGSADYEVPTEDWQSFPQFVEPATAAEVLVMGDVLQRLLSSVPFAAALEEGKYAMKAVLLESEGNKLTAVATDGKRLAVAEGVSTSETSTKLQTLIPRKAADLAAKMLEGVETQVVVKFAPASLAVVAEGWELTTRLVEGRFPPYRDVIPKKREAYSTINVELFESAVRAASIMADEESCRVSIECGESYTLAAQGASKGKSHIVFKPQSYSGKPITINFDPKYVVEGMRAAKALGETLELSLVNAERPAVFRAGETWLYLVVPLT